MSIEEFENISLVLGVGGLIIYMMFIIYDLARQSKAGKYAYIALFGVLGLGMFAFIAKAIIVEVMGL